MRCWSLEIALSLIICHRCGGQTTWKRLLSQHLLPPRSFHQESWPQLATEEFQLKPTNTSNTLIDVSSCYLHYFTLKLKQEFRFGKVTPISQSRAITISLLNVPLHLWLFCSKGTPLDLREIYPHLIMGGVLKSLAHDFCIHAKRWLHSWLHPPREVHGHCNQRTVLPVFSTPLSRQLEASRDSCECAYDCVRIADIYAKKKTNRRRKSSGLVTYNQLFTVRLVTFIIVASTGTGSIPEGT